jgi:hypothetical protein
MLGAKGARQESIIAHSECLPAANSDLPLTRRLRFFAALISSSKSMRQLGHMIADGER